MTAAHPRPPGITRPLAGPYLDAAGEPVTDRRVLHRIASLAIPPAGSAVWVDPDPEAKVQAVGVDAAGRTQYRYSEAWTRQRSREKFAHVPDFARALPALRAHVDVELRPRRATGVVEVTDPLAARWVAALLDRPEPDPALLAWQTPQGDWQRVHSSHVNAFVHAATGIDATAKQFRTWAGTVLAAAALGGARHDEKARTPQVAAVRATSRLLGNTPAVARSAYIHPGVLDAFAAGRSTAAAVAAAAGRAGDDRLAVVWRDPGVQDATLQLLTEGR